MSDKITKIEDIEDFEGFIKSYYEAREQLSDLRTEVKTLKAEKQTLEDTVDGLSDETVKKFKEKAIRAEIKAQLEADGVPNPDGVLKYLDLEGVDYDENDKLSGIDEKIESLKVDLPVLFDKKKRAARTDVDINADAPANTRKSTTESQVDALFR